MILPYTYILFTSIFLHNIIILWFGLHLIQSPNLFLTTQALSARAADYTDDGAFLPVFKLKVPVLSLEPSTPLLLGDPDTFS